MHSDREELRSFAHEAIMEMLSYNVKRLEAYAYLTNKLHLMHCSYELQCCIFDQDPVEYIRVCDEVTDKMKCAWKNGLKKGVGAYPL